MIKSSVRQCDATSEDFTFCTSIKLSGRRNIAELSSLRYSLVENGLLNLHNDHNAYKNKSMATDCSYVVPLFHDANLLMPTSHGF